jgi:hypothetical protein
MVEEEHVLVGRRLRRIMFSIWHGVEEDPVKYLALG